MNKKSLNELNLESASNGEYYFGGDNLKKVKSALGPALCLAKFTQVTMHLGSGTVHSCHHPRVHKIPLEELNENPAALFNSTVLKAARKEMLNDERPAECEYCWRIENKNNTSDRHYKSNEDWAIKEYDNVVNSTGEEIFKPTYLEVSFGNTCNMKCTYCGPEFSSQWVEEIKAKGPLTVTKGGPREQMVQGWQDLDSLSIPNREHNPYIEAFWKWFPEIYPSLRVFRITGGEPLLNKNTIKALDYVIKNPRPDLELAINTNLSIPDKVWNVFISKIKRLEKESNFKKVVLYTSFESWGNKAAYARTGIEFDLLIKRIEQLLNETSVQITVMATYNMFAITSFSKVLEYVLELKRKYNYNDHRNQIYEDTGHDIRTNRIEKSDYSYNRIYIDTPYLRNPTFLDAQYCDDDLLEYMISDLEFMIKNSVTFSLDKSLGFNRTEVDKFERIVMNRLYFNKKKYEDLRDDVDLQRAKFYDFVNAIDKRRNVNFIDTFPEMANFYQTCKQARKGV